MRILFILKQMGYVRHFDTVIEALAERGHVVRVGGQDGGEGLPDSLAANPRVSALACPKKRADEWREYASLVRRAGDYLNYLKPVFAGARKLRARAFEKLFQTLSDGTREPGEGWGEVALGLSEAERARLARLFALVEDAIPSDPQWEEFIAREAPDILLVTPLIDLGSAQTDIIKSARALGIPTGMLLFSWDNLSTKGGIHVQPDRVFVWNELQKREAVDLLGVEDDRIVITGAPRFDRFFELKPATTRLRFCDALGFDPSKPIIAYLGSSKFVSPNERRFIGEWVEQIRTSSDPVLAGSNLLVKPHPDLHREWALDPEYHIEWPGVGRASVTRPFGAERVAVVRSTFSIAKFLYECLYHSAAVVALNTSAELEAGIVGRPVYTMRVDPAIADGQASTLHFHYLLGEREGLVTEATGFDEHRRQLSDALASRRDQNQMRAFIQSFLRPAGLDVRASGVLAQAIEEHLGSLVRSAQERPAASRAKGSAAGKVQDRRAPVAVEFHEGGEASRILLDYPKATIWLQATSDKERKWWAHACAKQPWTAAWIEANVCEGDVLYDIGAGVGAFSLIAANRWRDKVTVVAFEPGYASFTSLCNNIVINDCDHNIIPVPLPLAGSTGLAGIEYRSLDPGQGRHALIDKPPLRPGAKGPRRYCQPVLAVRLDDLVSLFSLPYPNHLRLVGQDRQIGLLQGARRVLAHRHLRTLLVELDATLGDSVSALLRKAGFRLADTHGREASANGRCHGLFKRA